MAFRVEHRKRLLQFDVLTELKNVKANMIAKVKKFPYLCQSTLYDSLTLLKLIHRDLRRAWCIRRLWWKSRHSPFLMTMLLGTLLVLSYRLLYLIVLFSLFAVHAWLFKYEGKTYWWIQLRNQIAITSTKLLFCFKIGW